MTFPSYWKEISVVLAALFAIGSVIADVRDKRTKKITVWGRVFLLLTVLSMVGGFYAQWMDNAAEETRNKKAQSDMLMLLQKTETSVHELSRLLQPLDNPSVSLNLRPECSNETVKRFCEAVRKEVRSEIAAFHFPPNGIFSVLKVPWSSYRTAIVAGDLTLHFFKSKTAAEDFAGSACPWCRSTADLEFNVLFVAPEISPSQNEHHRMDILYVGFRQELMLTIDEDSVRPNLSNESLMSVVDIPGSTVVISGWLLKDFSITRLVIKTPRGQTIDVEGFTPVVSGAERKFVYHFGLTPPSH